MAKVRGEQNQGKWVGSWDVQDLSFENSLFPLVLLC